MSKSPYSLLFDWLLDGNINSPIPKDILKLPAKYILLNFMYNNKLVKILNPLLNNEHIHSLSNEDIFKALKYICTKHRITSKDIAFINKTIIEKHELLDKVKHKLPTLKIHEVDFLLQNYIDANEIQELLSSCGIQDKVNKIIKKPKEKAIRFKNVMDMFYNIKENDANCKICPLKDRPIVLFDSNNKFNVRNIDILFIAEAPGEKEVEKKVPLIGRSGQKLREFIKKYLDPYKITWFMSNTCLCRPENNATPNNIMIECCRNKLFDLIKTIKPKLIVLLGGTSLVNFEIKEKITKANGKIYKYKLDSEEYTIVPLLHPSAIIRNAYPLSMYDEGFQTILRVLKKNELNHTNKAESKENNSNNIKLNLLSNIFSYDQRFKDKYLIDVFRLDRNVYYILRDKENNKEVIKFDKDDFYFWTSYKNDIIISVSDADFHLMKYSDYLKNKHQYTNIMYESDVPIEVKHTLDFLNQTNVNHELYKPNIMFIDIEVYRGGYLGFPDPDKAEYPINAVTCYYNEKYYCLLLVPSNLKNKSSNELLDILLQESNNEHVKQIIESVKDRTEFKFYDNEVSLINDLVTLINSLQPDILTAWNVSFDLGYIITRMKRLNLPYNKLSPVNHVEADPKRNYIVISGYIILDMLTLYKGFTFEAKESYSLSFIANYELQDDKIQYEENLDNLYETNFQKFVFYNIKDVELIVRLNEKLKHIELVNKIRLIAKVTWNKALGTSGPVDALFIDKLHKQNLICRNYMSEYKLNVDVPGGYVKLPKGGRYRYVIDLDFSSLYPNLMRTYNIGPDTLIGVVDQEIALLYLYDKDSFSKIQQIKVKLDLYKGANKIESFTPKEFEKWINDKILTIAGTIYYKHETKRSFTYDIVTELLDNRKKYKKLMLQAIEENDKFKRETYFNYQYALKVLANSMYGALGFDKVRWYNPYMARSITLSGQEAAKISALYCDRYLENNDNLEGKTFIQQFKKDNVDTKYVIYMDTDSLFVNLEKFTDKNKSQDENVNHLVNNIIPKLQDYLNKEVLSKKLMKIHNINSDNCFLDLKQEIICKSIYFLDKVKKRYAAWIIYKEGKKVSEEDIKGLDIRRSDFPNLTKKKLEYLLKELILLPDKLNISKIKQYIKEVEMEFYNLIKNGDTKLARPVSFSKNLDEYKNLPQHIKGMIIWNTLEYEAFQSGTKGYLYKLKGIDIQKAPKRVIDNLDKLNEKQIKIDVIVVPQDVKNIPEYYIIDVQHMLKFAWLDRVNLLLGDMIKIHYIEKQQRQIATF